MNRFLKHVVDTNEISTKEKFKQLKRYSKTLIFLKLINVVVPTKIIAGEFGERTTRLEAKEVADLIQNADFEDIKNQVHSHLLKSNKYLSKIQLHLSTNITMKSMFNF